MSPSAPNEAFAIILCQTKITKNLTIKTSNTKFARLIVCKTSLLVRMFRQSWSHQLCIPDATSGTLNTCSAYHCITWWLYSRIAFSHLPTTFSSKIGKQIVPLTFFVWHGTFCEGQEVTIFLNIYLALVLISNGEFPVRRAVPRSTKGCPQKNALKIDPPSQSRQSDR